MAGELEGKVAFVTGGSRGIGRAICEALAAEGARVAVNYSRSGEAAEELASRINGIAVRADVSNRAELREAVRKVGEELGPISILVNNAGIMRRMSFEEYDEGAFMDMLRVNLMGQIYAALESLEDLKATRGVVVNVASNAALGTAVGGTTFYAITKAAVVALTKRMAFDLSKYGIRVNAVAPGWVETEMTVGGMDEASAERVRSYFRSRSELGMTGRPEHVAAAVLFLASDRSAYVNGQVLVVDGGRIDYLTHGV